MVFVTCRLHISLCENAAVAVTLWRFTWQACWRSVPRALSLWSRPHRCVHSWQAQFDSLWQEDWEFPGEQILCCRIINLRVSFAFCLDFFIDECWASIDNCSTVKVHSHTARQRASKTLHHAMQRHAAWCGDGNYYVGVQYANIMLMIFSIIIADEEAVAVVLVAFVFWKKRE